jgi:2-dehydropantoate 2-reductase
MTSIPRWMPSLLRYDNRCSAPSVLNGLAHFEALDARFGAAQVLGGTAHINAVLRPDGVVWNGDPLNRILFGERDRSKSARVQAIADAFARTTVEWKLSEDIVQDLWEKVTFLCTLASVTCLFRGNIGEIMAAPGGREAVLRAFEANVQVSTREGHAPRAAHVENGRARLTDPKGNWTASMLRDLEGGGRTRGRPHRRLDARARAPPRRGRHDACARVHAPQGVRGAARGRKARGRDSETFSARSPTTYRGNRPMRRFILMWTVGLIAPYGPRPTRPSGRSLREASASERRAGRASAH